jgi:hypothetical protein
MRKKVSLFLALGVLNVFYCSGSEAGDPLASSNVREEEKEPLLERPREVEGLFFFGTCGWISFLGCCCGKREEEKDESIVVNPPPPVQKEKEKKIYLLVEQSCCDTSHSRGNRLPEGSFSFACADCGKPVTTCSVCSRSKQQAQANRVKT